MYEQNPLPELRPNLRSPIYKEAQKIIDGAEMLRASFYVGVLVVAGAAYVGYHWINHRPHAEYSSSSEKNNLEKIITD